MRKDLKKVLAKLNEIEFRTLEISLSLACQMRKLAEDFNLSNEDLAVLFKVEVSDIKLMLNAAYDFDISHMAHLHAAYISCNRAKAFAEIEQNAEKELTTVNTKYEKQDDTKSTDTPV